MKKLLRLLLVRQPEGENKWWHRLARVVIYGSTIVVSVFAVIIFLYNSETWKKYSYNAFSFEDNYSIAKGVEVDCTTQVKPFNAYCNGDALDTSDLVKKYNSMVRKHLSSNTIDQICPTVIDMERPEPGGRRLTPKDISCITIQGNFVPISAEDFYVESGGETIYDPHLTDDQAGYLNGIWGKLLFLKAKRTIHIVYPVFFKNLSYLLLAVTGWFIFWESIVYKTLLYIIFGKKK